MVAARASSGMRPRIAASACSRRSRVWSTRCTPFALSSSVMSRRSAGSDRRSTQPPRTSRATSRVPVEAVTPIRAASAPAGVGPRARSSTSARNCGIVTCSITGISDSAMTPTIARVPRTASASAPASTGDRSSAVMPCPLRAAGVADASPGAVRAEHLASLAMDSRYPIVKGSAPLPRPRAGSFHSPTPRIAASRSGQPDRVQDYRGPARRSIERPIRRRVC